MAKASRKRIARYVVDSLETAGSQKVMRKVAAYVVTERREREVELIIRDIHTELEDRGTVLAEITTAHGLDEALRSSIKDVIGGERVELVERIDADVLGGVAIETPTRRLDATLKRKLITLRESSKG